MAADWAANGREAFKGIAMAGYPNIVAVLGPNTGLGHTSVILMMELQMAYIMQYINKLEKLGEQAYLDVKAQAQKAYNDELQSKFKNTVWTSGCQSFYMDKNGKNTTLYPRLTSDYRRQTKKLDDADFLIGNA